MSAKSATEIFMIGRSGEIKDTHIMFYKERFIRNAFLTSQNFKDFKEQTSQFQKN